MKTRSRYEDKHQEAVKYRSITPETYRGDRVEFVKSKINSLVQKDFIEDEFFYVDQYQYKNSEKSQVIHFGINTYLDNLKEELILHNSSSQLKPPSSKGSSKVRQEAYYNFVKQISLTDVEKLLTNSAIEYLKKNEGIKTVLLDVFERDADGTVNIKENIDTHTVVLYVDRAKNSLFVVDPSNPQFSSFLANFTDSPFDIKVGYIDKKIYKSPDKNLIGFHANQWRDCVDISVKLAFGFNEISPNFNFDSDEEFLKSIQNDLIIKNITNQQVINNNLLEDVELNPVRIRQASNYEFSKKANKKLHAIDMLFRGMKKFEKVIEPLKEAREKCIEKVQERLSVDYKPSNYSLALEDYNSTILNTHKLFNENLDMGISEYKTNLTGELENIIQDGGNL